MPSAVLVPTTRLVTARSTKSPAMLSTFLCQIGKGNYHVVQNSLILESFPKRFAFKNIACHFLFTLKSIFRLAQVFFFCCWKCTFAVACVLFCRILFCFVCVNVREPYKTCLTGPTCKDPYTYHNTLPLSRDAELFKVGQG